MKKHEFREHTADVLFDAYGSTFEEALEAAADALFETIADTKKLRAAKKTLIDEEAGNLEDLVVFTLSRMLGEMEAEELFFKSFSVSSFKQEGGRYSIQGLARGAPANPKVGRTVVKAVTHHLFEAEEGKKGWRLRVLLDV